jgi:hypothetical protein
MIKRMHLPPVGRCQGEEELCSVARARHPRVFHKMSAAAWPSVQRHGLLSTRRLVDLFELDSADRDRLLGFPRQVAVRDR